MDIHSLAAFWVRETKIVGDYFEFGVASGRSAIAALRGSRLHRGRSQRHFHRFDYFQGLPPMTGPDADTRWFKPGDYAYSEEPVIEKLRAHEVWDEQRITLHASWFEETLTPTMRRRLGRMKAVIVHIDCDLFDSTVKVREFITPLLRPGTVMLFDDWNCFGASNYRGERLALRQWLARKGRNSELERYGSYGWHGAAFIVDKQQ